MDATDRVDREAPFGCVQAKGWRKDHEDHKDREEFILIFLCDLCDLCVLCAVYALKRTAVKEYSALM